MKYTAQCTSGHFWTQLDTAGAQPDTSGTQLQYIWCVAQEHIWSTTGARVVCSPSAQLEHSQNIWNTAGIQSKCTSGHVWGKSVYSWTHLMCRPRVQRSIQSGVPSSVYPVYSPCAVQDTVQCISCVQFSVHPMYSPGYCPVYILCTIPFTVQCMIQYTFQYISSVQFSMHQFTSCI